MGLMGVAGVYNGKVKGVVVGEKEKNFQHVKQKLWIPGTVFFDKLLGVEGLNVDFRNVDAVFLLMCLAGGKDDELEDYDHYHSNLAGEFKQCSVAQGAKTDIKIFGAKS